MRSASNDEREVRVARNQALFRVVNEQIVGFGEFVDTVSIACECSRIDCVELLEIPPDAYRAVRESPRTFAVLADHVEAGIEHVVTSQDGYAVVEVEGHGAPVAEAICRSGRATVRRGRR